MIGVTTLTRVLLNLTVQQYYKDAVLTLVQMCRAIARKKLKKE